MPKQDRHDQSTSGSNDHDEQVISKEYIANSITRTDVSPTDWIEVSQNLIISRNIKGKIIL